MRWFTVHGRLHVVADRRAVPLPALHGTALRLRQGAWGLAARFSLGRHIGRAELAVRKRLTLRPDLVCDRTAGGPCLLWGSLAVQVFARAREALLKLRVELRQCGPGAVALFGMDRCALAALDGHEVPRDELPLRAQHRTLATDLPQGLQGVLPTGRQRRVIGAQLLSPPHELNVSVGLVCQATTRAEAVELAIQGELEQISRGRGRPPRCGGCGALDAAPREVEVVDEGIEETDGILCSNVVVEPRGAQDRFVAVCAVEKAHERTQRQKSQTFLVTVSSAIVYQNIAFAHSLALHLTAYSLRFAPLRSGFRQQVSLGVRRLPADRRQLVTSERHPV
jgi:hypothetical protein